MRRYLFTLPVLIFVLVMLYIPCQAQQGNEVLLYSENFEGQDLTGWNLEQGWEVREIEGGHALYGSGHSWAQVDAGPWEDYRFRFRLKLEAGSSLHANVRLLGGKRYFIGLNTNGTYISKQTGDNTFNNNLSNGRGLGSGWQSVEIAVYGTTIKVTINQKQWMSYTDPAPLISGKIAFESLQASGLLIDDVEVWGKAPTSTPTAEPGRTWIRTGGPLGGLGYDVRMRPDNPDVMFVTDMFAGVFTSVDGGQNWTQANEGITVRSGASGDAIPIFCLTIDPNNPDIIWTGASGQKGIFKSTNGGKSWVKMVNGIVENGGITFRGFTVDPTNSDIVYAAAELSSWIWNNGTPKSGREFDMTAGVVYKTTNGGQSWKKIWSGDNLARYIWLDPRNTNVLYVSTGIFDREAKNSDPQQGLPGGVGIIKSMDGGETWTQINNGLGNLYVGSLFMHPNNPDILLAGAGNVQYHKNSGVYLTTDGGQTWTQTLQTPGGAIIESVEFSLSDPNIAYAGGYERIYRSEDGGKTWVAVAGSSDTPWGSPGIQAGHPIDFQVDPRNPNRIFSNQYGGGNFLSADGGKTWTPSSRGYTGALVRDIAIGSDGEVIAGARSGIFVSFDGGMNWEGLSSPPFYELDWLSIAIDPSDVKHIISELNCSGMGSLVNSTNGGQSWTLAAKFREEDHVAWQSIAFAPSDPKIVYAGTGHYFSCGSFDDGEAKGMYASTDGGKTWQPANDSLSQNVNIRSIAISGDDPKKVFATVVNRGLFFTADGGRTWEERKQGLPGNPSTLAVALNPRDPKMVYLGLDRAGLYLSQDEGKSWILSSNGLPPEASINSIIIDPTNPSILYASDIFTGVYRSEDGGKNWRSVSTGLRMRAVNRMTITKDGLHLYAATEGDGVYRLDLNAKAPDVVVTQVEVKPTTAPTLTLVPRSTEPPTPNPTAVITSSPAAKTGKSLCPGSLIPAVLVGVVLVWRMMSRKFV